MKDRIVRKSMVFVIIILLLGISIYPSSAFDIIKKTSNPLNNGNTLYVGGNGPNNYTKIQDAIDNASDGDTVFVYDDSSPYYENIIVDKSINLVGENKNITVIDGGNVGDVISISADLVNITGFTITGSGYHFNHDGVEIFSNYNNVSGNIISNNERGIRLDSSSNNMIYDNSITSNDHFDIRLDRSNDNTILNNIISNAEHGIFLLHSSYNTISDNIISLNIDYGISLWKSSSYNIISWNTISSHPHDGIVIYYCNNNTIIGNIIYSNNWNGIWLYSSNTNNIYNNIISENFCGLNLSYSSNNNLFYHNNFINNTQNAYDECNNTWDDGKYGNYWSDYKEKYPGAKKKPFKGIWDTPYEIEGGDNKDNCPLIKQWPNSKSRELPRNRASYNSLLLWFLERFPLLERLLNLL